MSSVLQLSGQDTYDRPSLLGLPEDILLRVFESMDTITNFVSLSTTARSLWILSKNTARLRYMKETLTYDKLPVATSGAANLSASDALSCLVQHETAWSQPLKLPVEYEPGTFGYTDSVCGGYAYHAEWNYEQGVALRVDRMDLSNGQIEKGWLQHVSGTVRVETPGVHSRLYLDDTQDLLVALCYSGWILSQQSLHVWCYSLSSRGLHPATTLQEQTYTIPSSVIDVSFCGSRFCVSYNTTAFRNPGDGLTVVDWPNGTISWPLLPLTDQTTASMEIREPTRASFVSGDVVLLVLNGETPFMELLYLPTSPDISPTVRRLEFPSLTPDYRFGNVALSTLVRSQLLTDRPLDPRVLEEKIIAIKINLLHVGTDFFLVINRRTLRDFGRTHGVIASKYTAAMRNTPFNEWSRLVATTLLPIDSHKIRYTTFGVSGSRLLVFGERNEDSVIDRLPNDHGAQADLLLVYRFGYHLYEAQQSARMDELTRPPGSSTDKPDIFERLGNRKPIPHLFTIAHTISRPSGAMSFLDHDERNIVINTTTNMLNPSYGLRVFRVY